MVQPILFYLMSDDAGCSHCMCCRSCSLLDVVMSPLSPCLDESSTVQRSASLRMPGSAEKRRNSERRHTCLPFLVSRITPVIASREEGPTTESLPATVYRMLCDDVEIQEGIVKRTTRGMQFAEHLHFVLSYSWVSCLLYPL